MRQVRQRRSEREFQDNKENDNELRTSGAKLEKFPIGPLCQRGRGDRGVFAPHGIFSSESGVREDRWREDKFFRHWSNTRNGLFDVAKRVSAGLGKSFFGRAVYVLRADEGRST